MDNYLKFAWLLIFITAITILAYYVLFNVNSCTKDPASYLVSKYKDSLGKDVNITGNLIIREKYRIYTITFGDTNNTMAFWKYTEEGQKLANELPSNTPFFYFNSTNNSKE